MTENIKDALQYAVKLREEQDVLFYNEEKTYYDRNKADLKEIEPIKYADTLQVSSLTSLVLFLSERFRAEPKSGKLLIHVESPTKVVVYSELNSDRKRESLIKAQALLDKFPYGRFQDSEDFIINVQSLIQRDLDAEAILKCASAIRIEGGGDLVDNGVSQVASVKMGAATIEKAEVPSPATLRPYRTFLEVEQPSSPFVFRINKDGACALFEADGGLWKNIAMSNISEFLSNGLKEELENGMITIIA